MSGGADDKGKDKDPRDEKRVKDLVQPKGVERGAPLDAETIAHIVHWFGMPALEMAAATVPPPEHPGESIPDRLSRRRDEAMAHVQPHMVARIEKHTGDADRVRRLGAPVETRPWERARMTMFRMENVPNIPTAENWPEWHLTPEVGQWLEQRAPQAMLRDLHRPETEYERRFQPPWDDVFQPPDTNPFAAAREAIGTDHRNRQQVPPAVQTVDEASADLRAILDSPWPEAKRERARAREPELLAQWEEIQNKSIAGKAGPAGKPGGGRPVRR
jgi:hypothetical protein